METKETILVVDDNADIVAIIKRILEGQGYRVQCAYSGHEALAMTLLGEQKPDLIFLDVMMPQMDGLEVLTRLRASRASCSIPVSFMTVKGHYEDILDGYKQGADYYITKPFTSAQVINCAKILLRKNKERGAGAFVENAVSEVCVPAD